MGIELPGVPEVEGAIAIWRAGDARLATLLERYESAADALRHYGLILWDQGKPETAAQVFTGAVALVPQDARIWTDLAGALNASGQLHQAAACMEEALFRDKMQADGWLRLGSIRSALDDASGAEQALTTALALDPGLTDARLSLGLVFFHGKRFGEAAGHFRAVLETEAANNPAIHACYGQALSHLGDFSGAAAALKISIALEPHNRVVALKLAEVQFIADLIAGPVDAAALGSADPMLTPTEAATIERRAFHLLGAFGHTDAALRLGAARLAATPNDAECAYLLDVLRGEALQRSPDAYVTAFFDKFAEDFDKQLVGVLHYTAFQQLAALVETHAARLDRILDLGCGTGLAGPLLAKPGRRLVGLDLSPGMLDKAQARACYDTLIAAEAGAYLADKTAAFDLVFAADVLIYVGALDALLVRVANALTPCGLFAFTIETSDEADLALLPSGRFAHRLGHVLALAAASGFAVVATEAIQIRYETHGFVAGELVVLRKV
ncbi:methyltransferase domain-containing protein [Beijerinckia sp. L45]|uniref:tetratricopeptide repeat protein n=1 Tax=Beijerinckia sp. L45 TaxID=1641855 RepID=UPI00131E497D|nr:methyltransferase domain-containing protein [Beijerinckia sp. L45]